MVGVVNTNCQTSVRAMSSLDTFAKAAWLVLGDGSGGNVKTITMVLQWDNAAKMNVWMDFRHNCRTRIGLVKMLKRGVRQGHWIGWRIILINKEGGIG